MPMTQWDSDSLFVSLYVATGLVANADAQSLLLVGEPGEGKSELLRRFRQQQTIVLTSDVTIDGLRELMDGGSRTQHLRHILMPEFGRIFAHRPDTMFAVCGLLTSLMTRDAGMEMVGPRKTTRSDLTGRQLGVLGAMPTDTFRFHAKTMASTGFLSRFTVLGLRRSVEERRRVMENIYHGDRRDLLPFRLDLPSAPVEVTGANVYGPMVGEWLNEWYPHAGERLAMHLLDLLKAVALVRGRTEICADDVEVLKLFQSYFASLSFDGTGRIRTIDPVPTYQEYRAGVRTVSATKPRAIPRVVKKGGA